MLELVAETRPKARKAYPCEASVWIREILLPNISDYELTMTELRAIVRARRNHWLIQPGEVYLRQALNDGGEMQTFRAIPAMHQICIDHEVYPEA